ncbi:chemotaxis protein CheA [Paludibacterium yongneupense]|uniref:chemotaxis protein CheA n=1 Tax=Paludibacterium yongneupense TaxID=400061 RepID=UPI0003FAF3B2|nr:chemotaxis protein CheA [Paludibacterium yongneupense]
MNPLLDQFISEARDFQQSIGEKLMQLESEPGSRALIGELFRMVHTLKGNSGLFEFPEMTGVLHAGEDVLDAVRDGRVPYGRALADLLLEAMDFVLLLLDEIEGVGSIGVEHVASSARLARNLRSLLPAGADEAGNPVDSGAAASVGAPELPLASMPEERRMEWYRAALSGDALSWVEYAPDAECFFKGEDPLYQVGQVPGVVWRDVSARKPWPELAELDAYHCQLVFRLLSTAEPAALHELFRYMPHETRIIAISPLALLVPVGDPDGGAVYEDFVADAIALLDNGDLAGLERTTRCMLEFSAPKLWLASALRWLLLILELEPGNSLVLRALIESLRTLTTPCWGDVAAGRRAAGGDGGQSTADGAALAEILAAQREILALQDDVAWRGGRLKAVAATLAACCPRMGGDRRHDALEHALEQSLAENKAAPLLGWLDEYGPALLAGFTPAATVDARSSMPEPVGAALAPDMPTRVEGPEGLRLGRRSDDVPGTAKTLKVDQTKIDRLMNLIGEMVVAKNSLPYLAARAESQYGVRDLAREIKTQYAVVNRIAEEMQDAIMQVRMMPVSFIFQRFPRLVRDTSRKLGKEVNLVLEGEATEVDKNIVEALADPMIHIVRNSLDHGIELPALRLAAGKPAEGKLTIRASQAADRVLIEIIDDGKGIDPQHIKKKAYEKGVIDEATLERITDQEAVNLIFAAGFSTVETVSDLSGRGVGMDVVRNAMEKVGGTVSIESEKGKGTLLRLSLPLSMAVSNVMIVESDQQIFGVPMDMVVETVRVPRAAIRHIKQHQTTVLRGSIVPLLSLNALLAINQEQRPNEDDEFAALVIRHQGENIGIVVDDFRETVDIILKPLVGILGGLAGYSGSALLGDGTVLMVLNPRELT